MKRSLLVVFALVLVAAIAGAQDSHFHVARSILLGGEGGWDYITFDAPTQRLFVSHGTHVQVVDAKTDSLIGDIPDTPGVHGVALANDVGRGFTSNGRDSSVSVFDTKTFAVVKRIKLQQRNPDAITYDQASGRVFTFNGGSANTTAIDARTQNVVGTVPIGGKPEAAVPDGNGVIFVNNEDSATVVAFDSKKLKPLHVWSLAPGEEPSGLALDRAHHRLFSGCSNKLLVVLDSQSGRKVAELPIGEGVDGVAFDASRQLIFASCGEGVLTVIHEDTPDRYTVVENAPTQRGGRTLALDAESGTVYIPTAELGPPPAPTPERPHPRATIVPGTFHVMAVTR
jgi:DNA-binding beta-propeller fold protein YncE